MTMIVNTWRADPERIGINVSERVGEAEVQAVTAVLHPPPEAKIASVSDKADILLTAENQVNESTAQGTSDGNDQGRPAVAGVLHSPLQKEADKGAMTMQRTWWTAVLMHYGPKSEQCWGTCRLLKQLPHMCKTKSE
jgi:hypothetical protein